MNFTVLDMHVFQKKGGWGRKSIWHIQIHTPQRTGKKGHQFTQLIFGLTRETQHPTWQPAVASHRNLPHCIKWMAYFQTIKSI